MLAYIVLQARTSAESRWLLLQIFCWLELNVVTEVLLALELGRLGNGANVFPEASGTVVSASTNLRLDALAAADYVAEAMAQHMELNL